MATKEDRREDRPPAPKLEPLWEMDYEMQTISETLKEWWRARKKQRKRR